MDAKQRLRKFSLGLQMIAVDPKRKSAAANSLTESSHPARLGAALFKRRRKGAKRPLGRPLERGLGV